jgi:hypothetical protein
MADVVLICPSGVESGMPPAHRSATYEPWHHSASGHWLIRCDEDAALYFCWSGAGFRRAPDELQAEGPP